MNHRMIMMMLILVQVVSLESPLNIDAKISTTCPTFGFCDVIMRCALTKIKEFGFLYKSIGENYWILAKNFTKNPF